MLVGVISDTHGRLDEAAYAALADCDHIIHAGDICSPSVLRELETLAPVTAVLGNNDFDEYGPNVKRFAQVELGGVKFLVAHYPRDVHITAAGSAALAPGDPIPDVCIHGHTHVPRLVYGAEARPASYILNPGSTFRPRGGNPRSIAKIEIEETPVDGAPKDGPRAASDGDYSASKLVKGSIKAIRIEDLHGNELLSVGA